MSFCQHCGSELHHCDDMDVIEAVETAEEIADKARIRIAEIEAERDIKLARIAAGIAEDEREADLARAEGKAEALEQVISPEPEQEPEQETVVIEAPGEIEPEPEPESIPEAEPEPEVKESRPARRGFF